MARCTLETEKRFLYGVLGAAILGVLLMMISVGSDYWVIMDIPSGSYRNATKAYVIRHHSGLWKICRTEINNRSAPVIQRDYCQFIKFFPTQDEIMRNPELDASILDYSRSETAFAVISLLLMALGNSFAFYALREPRYMFKRLAAIIYLMTAACILVSAEVLSNSMNYERRYLPARFPHRATIKFGFCYYLAWLTFAIYLVAAIAFLACSRKRKGEAAGSEKAALENEPVHLGRI